MFICLLHFLFIVENKNVKSLQCVPTEISECFFGLEYSCFDVIFVQACYCFLSNIVLELSTGFFVFTMALMSSDVIRL